MLVPGRESSLEEGRVMNQVYFTATLDAAAWGAELASGEGRGHVYIVEPEADPRTTRTSRTKGSLGIRRCRVRCDPRRS
jgi:rifampin ADP-ribosylating transferase